MSLAFFFCLIWVFLNKLLLLLADGQHLLGLLAILFESLELLDSKGEKFQNNGSNWHGSNGNSGNNGSNGNNGNNVSNGNNGSNSTNGNNDGKYSNPEFDKLMDSSRDQVDVAARNKLYVQAEEILAKDMPKLEDWFHYRNLDVSTLKELCRRWKPELIAGFKKHQLHTALADIRESVEELKYYREHFIKS